MGIKGLQSADDHGRLSGATLDLYLWMVNPALV
jgi:hypothetical protein